MRQNRQSKLVAILALCVSVVGLTLGFAAFSNTLTISSSATVKPDQKEFLLKAYGLESADDSTEVWIPDVYTSEKISKPLVYGGSASDAKIESSYDENGSNKITISNLHATWTEPKSGTEYWFMIKNEGKYDAYLQQSEFDKITNINDSIVCTAASGTDDEMAQSACEGMSIDIEATSSDQTQRLSKYGVAGTDFIKINKYVSESSSDYILIMIQLYYDGERADGDFTVDFPDITLEFTSAPPAS